ncbi:CoA ester lyase [Sphingorhabdus lutea]|uniref:CoA ester lyase n=1 Tax=Sphingorhabdus lutea TaxID=1913578 RepID=A0A1L3JE58_9SPHN|nr:CoA ester lyase [Sphingorhabdus lutea]APG63417.1 CoA ester lyase [Sphingorhabdus lutea]
MQFDNLNLQQHRPRRSCLYVPGANMRAMEKVGGLTADVVIFDLEDAVLPNAKMEARSNIVHMLGQSNLSPKEVVIRVNDLSSPWGAADIEAAARTNADAILLPKVTCAQDIYAAQKLLSAALKSANSSANIGIWAMIEMPMALLNIGQIAACATNSSLYGFVMGINDLAKEMRALTNPKRSAFKGALQQSVMAARAYGLNIIDGVYNDIADVDGLRAECHQGRIYGFDGKTAIHPSQLEICNDIFGPQEDEIKQAQAIINAFADPENKGQGVIKVNGKMTELLHLEQAKSVILKSEIIAKIYG